MSKAALLQFKPANTVITRHSSIRSSESIRDIVKQAEADRALIVHTFASAELRRTMEEACQKRSVPSHDLLGLLLEKLHEFIGMVPTEKPGLLHQVDDGYFERVDALAYTVRHDDLRTPGELDEADIILVGVSRTSKTPLSIYLAQEGWRVANIPLVGGEPLPKELDRVDPKKVVGLIATAERLAEIRQARLSRLGANNSSYADLAHVQDELSYCRDIFAQHPGWLIVDVTVKSVEETASEILDRLFGRERRLQ
jgi:regulator of PEP synthase PpsR (kinase-PPPase family)